MGAGKSLKHSATLTQENRPRKPAPLLEHWVGVARSDDHGKKGPASWICGGMRWRIPYWNIVKQYFGLARRRINSANTAIVGKTLAPIVPPGQRGRPGSQKFSILELFTHRSWVNRSYTRA